MKMRFGYFDRFQRIFGRVKPILENRWIRLATQIIIVSLSIFYLAWNYRDASEMLSQTTIDFRIVFGALFLTLVAVYLGAIGWGFTLLAFDPNAVWKDSIRTHLQSNLAKYIPGYAWQLIGKAYLTNKGGTPGVIVGIAMITELTLLVLLGLGLSLTFIPRDLVTQWLGFVHQLGFLSIRLIGLTLIIAVPFIMILIINRAPRLPEGFKIHFHMLLLANLSIFIGWVLFGFSFWMIARAINPIPLADLPGFMFTLAASVIIGLAIVIVPGSIGVRESIMVYFLSSLSILSPIAVMIAIISRIIVTISEITGYLIFQFTIFSRGNNKIARKS
jgi:uncharacterized membrane protein YbhN (UPF0104 family)